MLIVSLGSRGAFVTLKFTVDVLFKGMKKPVLLTSTLSKPFVVCLGVIHY
jgi:hypothetical protein